MTKGTAMMHSGEMFLPFPALHFEIPCKKKKEISYQTSLQMFQLFFCLCKYLFFHPLVIMNGGEGMRGNIHVVLSSLFIRPVSPDTGFILRNAFLSPTVWVNSQTGQVQ